MGHTALNLLLYQKHGLRCTQLRTQTLLPPFGQLRRVEGGWWAGWSGWVGWLAGWWSGWVGWLAAGLAGLADTNGIMRSGWADRGKGCRGKIIEGKVAVVVMVVAVVVAVAGGVGGGWWRLVVAGGGWWWWY